MPPKNEKKKQSLLLRLKKYTTNYMQVFQRSIFGEKKEIVILSNEEEISYLLNLDSN